VALGARLGVSRSSFYWYFESRQDLLDALLDAWEVRNTAQLRIAARVRRRRSRGRSATSSSVSSTRTCSIPASISRCGNGRGAMSRSAPASMPPTRRGSRRSRRCLHDTDMNRPRPTSGRAYCIFNSWAITRWISGSRWTIACRALRGTWRGSPVSRRGGGGRPPRQPSRGKNLARPCACCRFADNAAHFPQLFT
jgi:AcrR family transcriptional regulator